MLPILLALLVVIVLAAGLAWWTSGNNGDPNGSAAPPTHSGSPSHSRPSHSGATSSPSPTPTPTPSSTPASPSASTAAPAPAGHGMLGFPRTYYGVLPGDTRAGWQMLSSGYRSSMGYGSYRGFWDSISSVSVGDVTSAGADAVDVDLTYVKNDGGTSSETRRLYLQRSGDSWVITSDRVVG